VGAARPPIAGLATGATPPGNQSVRRRPPRFPRRSRRPDDRRDGNLPGFSAGHGGSEDQGVERQAQGGDSGAGVS